MNIDQAATRLDLDLWGISLAEAHRTLDQLAPGALGLDAAAVRRLFQITDNTLRAWTKDGDLAVVKVGERKSLFTKQSLAHKIARGYDTHSVRETPSFWAALPTSLTPEQVLEALPGRFADLTAVHRAVATRALVGRLVAHDRSKRVEVPREALRRYAQGLPQVKPMFSTSEEEQALSALWSDPNGAYASAAPTGSWSGYDLAPRPALDDLDDLDWDDEA